jgi:hypothetical protein
MQGEDVGGWRLTGAESEPRRRWMALFILSRAFNGFYTRRKPAVGCPKDRMNLPKCSDFCNGRERCDPPHFLLLSLFSPFDPA